MLMGDTTMLILMPRSLVMLRHPPHITRRSEAHLATRQSHFFRFHCLTLCASAACASQRCTAVHLLGRGPSGVGCLCCVGSMKAGDSCHDRSLQIPRCSTLALVDIALVTLTIAVLGGTYVFRGWTLGCVQTLVFVFQTERSSAPCTLRGYFLLGKNIKFAALVLTLIMVSAGVNAVRDAKLP